MARISLLGLMWMTLSLGPGALANAASADDPAVAQPQTPHQDPEITLEGLTARANEWHEPSEGSEVRYVEAINQWLDELNPTQRTAARKILADAHPDMMALRKAIREKKAELASLTFNQHTSPDTLPRLGQELTGLRRTLSKKLKQTSERLQRETGVKMELPEGDGFWLVPRDSEPRVSPNA